MKKDNVQVVFYAPKWLRDKIFDQSQNTSEFLRFAVAKHLGVEDQLREEEAPPCESTVQKNVCLPAWVTAFVKGHAKEQGKQLNQFYREAIIEKLSRNGNPIKKEALKRVHVAPDGQIEKQQAFYIPEWLNIGMKSAGQKSSEFVKLAICEKIGMRDWD